MKRRLLAILMADMVDYSRKMKSDQTRTITLIHDLRGRWLEPETESRGGEVLKRMGDGWIIGFGSVTDAVEAAQAVQAALAPRRDIQLRISIHLGEIVDDGTDLYGNGLNVAARLQTEAPPGGVIISADLHRQLEGPRTQEFQDASRFRLKNIAQPVQAYHWRPTAAKAARADEVPVVAVERLAAIPDRQDAQEAAEDFRQQILRRLARRTGIHVLAAD